MKPLLSFILIFILNISHINAQPPIEFLKQQVEKNPIQKAYLHLDRENYVAGEIVHFKAYLTSDFLPDTTNTNLYVELFNSEKLISKYAYPVFLSSAVGSITLLDSLPTGYYSIRAYTGGMLAQNEAFLFTRNIYVYGAQKLSPKKIEDSIKIEFFPEGGNLVTGLSASVAFKATNTNGMPVNIVGKLYNDKLEKLANISCLHDGMGLVEVEPIAGQQYFITLANDKEEKKFYLPNSIEKGIAISVIPNEEGFYYEIKQKLIDNDFTAAYMIGQMQHHIVFKKEFKNLEETHSGTIKPKGLPSGIMQITIFNKADMPLAERLVFINNNEYKIETAVLTDTLDFSAGGYNKFTINLKDTLSGQVSVGITDPAFDINTIRENNIISSLLLTSDIKGNVVNPAYYFSSTADSVKNALDILMMVNGWRRFLWSKINVSPQQNKYSNAFITLKGKITLQDSKKPFYSKKVLLLTKSLEDKKRKSTMFVDTDWEGKFKLDSLILIGKNILFFTDTKGKKSTPLDVYLEEESIIKKTEFKSKIFDIVKYKNETLQSTNNDYYLLLQKAKGDLLKEVVVTGVKKSVVQKLEEKYASEMFLGNASNTIDLVNSKDATSFPNIFEYLKFRVNGLQIINADGEYKALYRQQPSGISNGYREATLFLDEIQTDVSMISSIPAYQIAMVKVYSSLIGVSGNGSGGVIAIYTKKQEDYKDGEVQNNIKIYNGYSITKEFYAPNYKLSKEGLSTDIRTTIDWRPQIFFNGINPKIPFSFYNNSRTKSFKIVVEGISSNGKLIWLEKIITL
jgi:hypothetical protein